MVDTTAAEFTPTGYPITSTDRIEWNIFWSYTKEKWWYSYIDYFVSEGFGEIVFGGIDCQATSLEYNKNNYCRYNFSSIP